MNVIWERKALDLWAPPQKRQESFDTLTPRLSPTQVLVSGNGALQQSLHRVPRRV